MKGRDIAAEYITFKKESDKKNHGRDIEHSLLMQFKINVFDPENMRVCKHKASAGQDN